MTATPHNRASKLALQIYQDVIEGVRGDRLVKDSVQLSGSQLTVQDKTFDLQEYRRVFVCGAGKASFAMAEALAQILGPRMSGGIVITKTGHGGVLPGIEVLEAGHPVPNAASIEAGGRMWQFAQQLQKDDLVLFALSGGASALMELPLEGLSLDQLQGMNREMLENAFSIHVLNELRTAFSRIKGGRLGEAFMPATVMVIVLSDVIASRLDSIGSAPFWNERSDDWLPVLWQSTDDETLKESCHQKGLPRTPLRHLARNEEIRQILESNGLAPFVNLAERTTPHLTGIFHRIVGSNVTAVEIASQSGAKRGLQRREAVGPPMEGDVRREAIRIMGNVIDDIGKGYATEQGCFWVYSGEPTVTVRGSGLGGRCQELACVASTRIVRIEGIGVLAGSTDGTDGPTDVGAGLVDERSVTRAKENGITAEDALVTSDSHRFLAACGGLIRTGPTQSNVNDIVIAVRMPD